MKYKVGMYGGSFDPLHVGHINDMICGAAVCEELYVVLSWSATRDSAPVEYRYRWIHQSLRHLSNVTILMIEDTAETKELYTDYCWQNGANEIRAKIGKPIDVVFCGSDYKEDGCFENYYPESEIVYFERKEIPVSSTQIRSAPFEYWQYLPQAVRPYFVKRILFVGSESTGKSTLVQNLAAAYNTNFVREVGREVSDLAGGEEHMIMPDLMANIVFQKAEEWKMLQTSNRLLFCDTDALTTHFYTDLLLSSDNTAAACKALAIAVSRINQFDLVFFLEPTVNFVQDGTRNERIAAERELCSQKLKSLFDKENIPYICLSGDYLDRYLSVREAIYQTYHIFE